MKRLLSRPIVERVDADTLRISTTLAEQGIDPHLAIIMIGDNPQSATYVEMKSRRAKKLGITTSLYHLPNGIPFHEALATVEFLADDTDIHGIILQLPVTEYVQEEVSVLIMAIPSEKDVDGLRGDWVTQLRELIPRTTNEFSSFSGQSLPATMLSVLSLLDEYEIPLNGQIVIIGDGPLVGHPLALYFAALGLQYKVVTDETDGILEITKLADLLITGTGQPDLVTYQWVKEGAAVINCAMDVHEDSVSQVASALAPATGGVGPLTISWLLHNAAVAAERSVHV